VYTTNFLWEKYNIYKFNDILPTWQHCSKANKNDQIDLQDQDKDKDYGSPVAKEIFKDPQCWQVQKVKYLGEIPWKNIYC